MKLGAGQVADGQYQQGYPCKAAAVDTGHEQGTYAAGDGHCDQFGGEDHADGIERHPS